MLKLKLERKGGERVNKGTYWNTSNGERVRMDGPGVLPGDASQAYLRFHPLALLVLGPILGLVYAIFMPLTAIVMVFWVLGGKILGAFAPSVMRFLGLEWRRVVEAQAVQTGPGESVEAPPRDDSDLH